MKKCVLQTTWSARFPGWPLLGGIDCKNFQKFVYFCIFLPKAKTFWHACNTFPCLTEQYTTTSTEFLRFSFGPTPQYRLNILKELTNKQKNKQTNKKTRKHDMRSPGINITLYLCKSSLANWLNFFLQGKHRNRIFIWDSILLAVLWSGPYKDPRNLATHFKVLISPLCCAFQRLFGGLGYSEVLKDFSSDFISPALISSYLTFLLFVW